MADPMRLPKARAEEAKRRFDAISKPEITFEAFVEQERQFFELQQAAEKKEDLYQPGLPTMTPCGGGDFETEIDLGEWQGAFGTRSTMGSGAFPFANFVAGIFEGPINAGPVGGFGTSHQTWVGAGPDPIVPISLTPPGSAGAVRVGNAMTKHGVDLISKTFTVPANRTSIKFWYALVLQNPQIDHPPSIQPYFWVRVSDSATGAVIPGAADLGGGVDQVVADKNNPFFVSIPDPTQPNAKGEFVVYRDWTCAQINLASHVGKRVTVEFITVDCDAGGHWAYAYIDNFCGDCAGSPEGNFNFAAGTSSPCGEGKLCFEYSVPESRRDPATGALLQGSVQITLDLMQNEAIVHSMVSPVLTTGTEYCFDIDASVLAMFDPALGGFDFVATSAFKVGTINLAPMSVGSAPDGLLPGLNNDYKIACKAFSYAVKFVCGTQADCNCACTPVRPGSYATEINIYNHGDEPAEIVKYVIPVVFGGAAAGREPRTVTARAEDRITLPPQAATMDDCCRLSELLLGAPAEGPAPLSIGFLEIVSPVELTVTAVYTASGPGGGPVSIDVQQIEAKPRRAAPPRPAVTPGAGSPAKHH